MVKIPHTGDTESLDRCGEYDQYKFERLHDFFLNFLALYKFFFGGGASDNFFFGRVGLAVAMSVCCGPLPMRFICVVGLVQSMPSPWTGAILISSKALKTRLCSRVRSPFQSRVEP